MFVRDRPQRAIQRIDYNIYNRTGKKLGRDISAKMERLIEEDLKIVRRFNRFYEEYEISLLFEVTDLEVGIRELKELAEKYEDAHIKLEKELGEAAYKETYVDYEKHSRAVSEWIKAAKLEIKNKKALKDVGKEREVRAEEKYFSIRIKNELQLMKNENSPFVENYEKNLIAAQKLIDGYSEIFVKIESLGVDLLKEFHGLFDETLNKINSFVQDTKNEIQKIKSSELEKEEKLKEQIEFQKYEQEKGYKIMLCSNLYDNICERFLKLEVKCISVVEELSDPDLLTEKRELKSLDADFMYILDRITKLSVYNPNQYDETGDFLIEAAKRKQRLKVSMDMFRKKLEYEIEKRDLTEEKMKNASILGIKLPKFKGYESQMDYYTFKSEFEKLIMPRVKATLLPEYLKNNFLDGQALQLVKEIDALDDIWERLKMSYGSVEILLNKQLEELEKGTPLYKIKSEEKLIQSILKLKNSMLQLKALAKRHGIEKNLFHSSNLARVYNMMGKKWQLDITKKFLDSDKTDEEKWNEIIEFLEKEMKIKEQMLLFEKSYAKSEEKTKGFWPSDSKSYVATPHLRKKCVICEKSDHVPTVTKKGYTVVNYFACEKFVKMSPQERFEELKRKKLCCQCLTPGLKFGHVGKCFDKYK